MDDGHPGSGGQQSFEVLPRFLRNADDIFRAGKSPADPSLQPYAGPSSGILREVPERGANGQGIVGRDQVRCIRRPAQVRGIGVIANMDNVDHAGASPENRRKKNKLVDVSEPAEKPTIAAHQPGENGGRINEYCLMPALQQLAVQEFGIAGHALLKIRLIVGNEQNSHQGVRKASGDQKSLRRSFHDTVSRQ